MEFKSFEEQSAILALLDEPVRRRLYEFVASREAAVGRDEAAKGTGATRALAAFHLDKLVEAGLLEASFERRSGRTGPGAGRPSKLYRRAAVQLDVSVPQRRYELAAHVLAQALGQSSPDGGLGVLKQAARDWGRRVAAVQPKGAGRGAPATRVVKALERFGFEPRKQDDEIVLKNCPFDTLREEGRERICAMNLALIEGCLEGMGLEGVRARLAPRPGMCCVAIRAAK